MDNQITQQTTIKNTYILLLIAGILVIVDQLTKFIAMGVPFLGISIGDGVREGEYIDVIGSFLQFTYVENPGMAFGISFGPMKIVLTLFSLVASIALVYVLVKKWYIRSVLRVAIMLILAGAFGNFIDRMFYGVWFQDGELFHGRVVDFIMFDIPDIHIGDIFYSHFPVFNIADSCVTIGIAILLLNYKHLSEFEKKEDLIEN